jgi:orotate phosphoribosyltransferase
VLTELTDKERLLYLITTKALEIGSITLSSGRISDYYIDCKRVTLSPVGAYLTAKLMLEMIGDDVSAAAGLTLGADPIVSSIAVLSHIQGRNIQAMIVRKEPKKHGTMSFIEGPAVDKGAKVVVVDDVVTSGSSLLKSIERLVASDFKPVQVLAILDRQEGGREAIKEAGYNLETIFTREDLKIEQKINR